MLSDNIAVARKGYYPKLVNYYADIIEELKAQGMEYLVVDIRNNCGGYDNVAGALASLFTEEKRDMFSLGYEDKSGYHITENQYIYPDGRYKNLPVAVLVNADCVTASDGKEYNVDYYNLDVIISVGYRVKSLRGTQFRIWATGILKEYIKKGFAMDDDRLKRLGGGNYFEELLARIRDIRSSEKVFWRKVLEIYATSIDYNPNAEESIIFFKQVQNKMHWAAHKH